MSKDKIHIYGTRYANIFSYIYTYIPSTATIGIKQAK